MSVPSPDGQSAGRPVQLCFWGVRGSIPVPGPGTARYGGNTPCVSLEADGLPLLVLDAGTGARALGAKVEASGPRDIEVVLTHTHWDHIHGLGFFPPLYGPQGRVRITGPRQPAGLRAVLERLTAQENFPIPSSRWAGLREIREVEPGPLDAGGWQLQAVRLNHPGHTLGYRIDGPGMAGLAYLTDNELTGNRHGLSRDWRQNLVDCLRGVGTVIHDTTWRDDQAEAHAGWGHSSPGEAVELVAAAGCRQLYLFHHSPEHDDETMDRLLDEARRAGHRAGVVVVAAIEGSTLMLDQED
jgi:phosphoribosyl 1,2-cyclic phosphodiesterase